MSLLAWICFPISTTGSVRKLPQDLRKKSHSAPPMPKLVASSASRPPQAHPAEEAPRIPEAGRRPGGAQLGSTSVRHAASLCSPRNPRSRRSARGGFGSARTVGGGSIIRPATAVAVEEPQQEQRVCQFTYAMRSGRDWLVLSKLMRGARG